MKNIISKYVIVSDSDCREVAAKVNKLIEEGYQPLGGPCVGGGADPSEPIYTFQAMVTFKSPATGKPERSGDF